MYSCEKTQLYCEFPKANFKEIGSYYQEGKSFDSIPFDIAKQIAGMYIRYFDTCDIKTRAIGYLIILGGLHPKEITNLNLRICRPSYLKNIIGQVETNEYANNICIYENKIDLFYDIAKTGFKDRDDIFWYKTITALWDVLYKYTRSDKRISHFLYNSLSLTSDDAKVIIPDNAEISLPLFVETKDGKLVRFNGAEKILDNVSERIGFRKDVHPYTLLDTDICRHIICGYERKPLGKSKSPTL